MSDIYKDASNLAAFGLVFGLLSLSVYTYYLGVRHGQSQCYPYAVPYSEAKGGEGSL